MSDSSLEKRREYANAIGNFLVNHTCQDIFDIDNYDDKDLIIMNPNMNKDILLMGEKAYDDIIIEAKVDEGSENRTWTQIGISNRNEIICVTNSELTGLYYKYYNTYKNKAEAVLYILVSIYLVYSGGNEEKPEFSNYNLLRTLFDTDGIKVDLYSDENGSEVLVMQQEIGNKVVYANLKIEFVCDTEWNNTTMYNLVSNLTKLDEYSLKWVIMGIVDFIA